MNNRRRVTCRPSKGNAIIQMVMGLIFVLIGIFAVIPSIGLFGVVWTLFAGLITGRAAAWVFGKKSMDTEIFIEEDQPVRPADPVARPTPAPAPSRDGIGLGPSPEKRLQQLQQLLDSGLITKEEFDAKRAEILRGL